jgi:nucleoside-diphosphate-sugar epimerase
LVTGHRGFSGHYVTEALSREGFDVVGLTVDGGLDTAAIDILDRQDVMAAVAAIRPTHVIHLAAIAFVAHGDAEEMYRVNVVGTRNLLEALAKHVPDIEHVLLASSANVYGNSDQEVLSEGLPPRPANDYAVSKIAMEYMARLWMPHVPITLVRPFNYTGVGQADQFLLPKVVGHFRRGERAIELGNIDVAREFQDVRFVASVYVRILKAPPAGDAVNLCSGISISLTDVIRAMESIAGYAIDVKVNPAFVRANEVARLTGDTRRLVAMIGPLDTIPLEETLRWMYAHAG